MDFPIRVHPVLRPLLWPLGASGPRSVVRVEGGRIRLVFGALFDQTFPLEQVRHLRPARWPWWRGVGLRLGLGGVLGLIGRPGDVVRIELRAPQRVRVVVPVPCRALYVSVADPSGLIATATAELHKHL